MFSRCRVAILAACGLMTAGALTPAVVQATPRPAAQAVVHGASYEAVTIVRLLNLRSAPSLQARVIVRLAEGAHLRVHGYTAHWLAVTTRSGIAGYVIGQDIRPLPIVRTPATSAPRLLFRPPFLAVHVGAANLRSAPTTTAPVLQVLTAGTRVSLQSGARELGVRRHAERGRRVDLAPAYASRRLTS